MLCCKLYAQVQRALQLRIEEHARYLQKIFEEQQKAGSALIPSQNLLTVTSLSKDSKVPPSSPSTSLLDESKADSPSSVPSKSKGNDEPNTESNGSRKRICLKNKPERTSDDEDPVQ